MTARQWLMGQDLVLPTAVNGWLRPRRGTYWSIMGRDVASYDVMGGDRCW